MLLLNLLTLKLKHSDPHPEALGIFRSSFSDYPNSMPEISICFPPRVWLDPKIVERVGFFKSCFLIEPACFGEVLAA